MSFKCFICGKERSSKALYGKVLDKKICTGCRNEATPGYVNHLLLFDSAERKATIV